MGRAHAGLELVGRLRIPLEDEQRRRQHLCLRIDFRSEQLEQRSLAQAFRAHAMLRWTALKRLCSSSTPTVRPAHTATVEEKVVFAFATVAGTSLRSVALK